MKRKVKQFALTMCWAFSLIPLIELSSQIIMYPEYFKYHIWYIVALCVSWVSYIIVSICALKWIRGMK